MAVFILGYDGEWRERFDDRDAAIRHAEALAVDGTAVEVVSRRFGFHSFVTGFPEPERDALRARWSWLPSFGDGGGGWGDGGAHHHYGSIGGHGGGHGGGGHGGGLGGH
jgi:hypothetical protein